MRRDTALMLHCEQNDPIQEIRIIMCWHKSGRRDWSIAIDGRLHAHISTEILEALIESEVLITETSLTDQECADQVWSVQ
jgi:hypothetical protein